LRFECMIIHGSTYLHSRLSQTKPIFPLECQFELTYRCNLRCIHCYCKGLEHRAKELSTTEVKRILDELAEAGCVWLALTGGDPFVRRDFLSIYKYAKAKGFIITLFSNAQGLTKKIIAVLAASPPFCLEVTLNGITAATYERISRIKGSFCRAMQNIRRLKDRKIPLLLKTNCLTENRSEVVKIKQWVEDFLGRPAEDKYYFQYDPMIFPRLNGDTAPCRYRLSPSEVSRIVAGDSDLSRQYRQYLECDFPRQQAPRDRLYQCDSWEQLVIIDPFGKARFCQYSDRFSIDLKKERLARKFAALAVKIRQERFTTDSRCRDCRLRPICNWCPARAYLETGDREKPVDYFCAIARSVWRKDQRLRREKKTVL